MLAFKYELLLKLTTYLNCGFSSNKYKDMEERYNLI